MSSFAPANRLEQLLVLAATEPSARPDFYRELLGSTLYVVTPDQPATESVITLAKETRLKLVNWQGKGGPIVPIFSSRERLEGIGIDSTDYAKDVADAGLVAKEVGDVTPVDFVDVGQRENNGLSGYLLENTKPFHERTTAKPWWKVW